MNEIDENGRDVFRGVSAVYQGKHCVWFGVKIDDDGKKWAIIGELKEIPIEELGLIEVGK